MEFIEKMFFVNNVALSFDHYSYEILCQLINRETYNKRRLFDKQ